MSKRKKQATDGRLALVDLDDPTVTQVARMFRALGLRLELWTEPLTRDPTALAPEHGSAVDQHIPALHPTANPHAWAVYCPGCSSDAHPGVYPCRLDDAPGYWVRLPLQITVTDP